MSSERRDYRQSEWDARLEEDARALVRLAVREDLDRFFDWTTVSLVGDAAMGKAAIVARRAGVIAGLEAARITLVEYDPKITWTAHAADGARVAGGMRLAEISGPARSLLTAERPMLNILGHLSGIASLARKYVDAVAGTKARIYDTRKTLPGWRRLEKYAVRCGGGHNHRTGLYDGVLIKDNHLAFGAEASEAAHYRPAEAVARARQFLQNLDEPGAAQMLVEIEVDRLEQLREVLPARPDIVLLDNMPPATLAEAVTLRDQVAPDVELEASGGVDLSTVGAIAKTGIDRISVGALTHSAAWFDVGLDWE